jgi:hypothetical protein
MDEVEAVKWYRKAADQGNPNSQSYLGECYRDGSGVTVDYAEAARWYRKAADQSHPTAQNNLGWCYANGDGVAQDFEEAIKWFQKAAELGHAEAQYSLGYCYYNGQGVVQDFVQAYKWLNLASIQGDTSATARRDILAATLTPDQITEAQRLSREYQPIAPTFEELQAIRAKSPRGFEEPAERLFWMNEVNRLLEKDPNFF